MKSDKKTERSMGTVKSTALCKRFFSRLRARADDVSAFGQHRKFPPYARKTSGSQGTQTSFSSGTSRERWSTSPMYNTRAPLFKTHLATTSTKFYEDLFLPLHVRYNNMLLEGIHIEKLGMIRTNAGDKEEASVDAEKILDALFGKNYRIRLDHQNTRKN